MPQGVSRQHFWMATCKLKLACMPRLLVSQHKHIKLGGKKSMSETGRKKWRKGTRHCRQSKERCVEQFSRQAKILRKCKNAKGFENGEFTFTFWNTVSRQHDPSSSQCVWGQPCHKFAALFGQWLMTSSLMKGGSFKAPIFQSRASTDASCSIGNFVGSPVHRSDGCHTTTNQQIKRATPWRLLILPFEHQGWSNLGTWHSWLTT